MMFNAPLSMHRADNLITSLDLSADKNLVDLGCGDGSFLNHIASQYSLTGVGIDNKEALIQKANSQNINNSNIRFICGDALEYTQNMSPVDTIVCIGSEFIFGGYQALLNLASKSLTSQGRLLIGTIYWKQAPASDYIALLDGEDPYFNLEKTVAYAYDSGFIPLEIQRANDDEWDTFESHHSRKRYLAAIDSDDSSRREMTWQWQQAYLKWGMRTMGFCFLVLQKV
jgi:cyclopropane fatty-acyl-phospholipid synthase-like methyltransferase